MLADAACDAELVRALIVDDNASFLRASSSLLERQGLSVVGTATNGAEASEQAQRLSPDVILVDIDLGQESGFTLATRLTEQPPSGSPLHVILISTHAQDEFADLIAASPALGFIPKSRLSMSAIRELLDQG